ncbi:very long-chain acyl-CoA synthetase-like, partial [Elysia marginata]
MPELNKLQVYVQGATQQSLPQGIESFDDLVREAPPGTPSPSLRSGVKMTDTCCYIYTSGTTGLPKPVYISHAKFAGHCAGMPSLIELTQEDVVYVVIPLYHSTGLFLSCSAAMTSGCSLLLRKRFSASEFWSDCRNYNVTIVPYVGEVLRYLLSQPK